MFEIGVYSKEEFVNFFSKHTDKDYIDRKPIIHFKIYEDAGKITMTTPEKWSMYKVAERSYESKLTAEIALGGYDLKDKKKALQRLKDKQPNESDKAAIKSLACFLCLEDHFNKLAKETK